MNGKFFLDTNAIIDSINKKFKFPKHLYFISIITEMELLSFSKLTYNDEILLRQLLENFQIVNISDEIKEKSIFIRKNYGIKLPDSIICASSIVEKAILISDDKQLKKIDNLKIVSLDEYIQ